MKKIIHINQHRIRYNAKCEKKDRKPVVTCKTYKQNVYGYEVEVDGPCKVIYSPDAPLSCGARVYITTLGECRVIDGDSVIILK